jgi:hypothetical protein
VRLRLAALIYVGGMALCIALADVLGTRGVIALSVAACTLTLALIAVPLVDWSERRRQRRGGRLS